MIDARGYACPLPVVMVQKAVAKDGPAQLEVLLDNPCSVENVTRFAANHGYVVESRPAEDGEYVLLLTKKP